jgi:DNA modification methylase
MSGHSWPPAGHGSDGMGLTIAKTGAIVGVQRRRHALIYADSRACLYRKVFDLVLTSPPYFHPVRSASSHGVGFAGNLTEYVETVSDVLVRCSEAVTGKRLCIVKTDIWHKGTLIPLGFRVADACSRKGLRLRAHWVWQRVSHYSPYSPSFSNVFVFADDFERPHVSGLLTEAPLVQRHNYASSFWPDLFGVLVNILTRPNQTILDPFAGLGGVIFAAASCNRRSVGIEISLKQTRRALPRLKDIPSFAFLKADTNRQIRTSRGEL